MIKKRKKYLHILQQIEKKFLKENIPIINIGDNIKIKKLIQEGQKERIQTSDGVVISKRNTHLNTTITIRKIIQNVGVEKVYLVHSPQIINIEILGGSKVRKSKLYYLRKKLGKATRLKQKFN
uniref:Large ribosomal subunit protein bL19c n=1 Tax=Sonderella linearis TaxID=110477 RepID=A0A1Z1MMX0_9FLOR|nr:ribosomal protein L19 [Sonderella linearis]ARW67111.1 ribosomal protein L19 [Sonderella linearis]